MDNFKKICKAIVLFLLASNGVFAQNYKGKLWDYAIRGTYNPIEKLDGSISLPSFNIVFQMDSALNFNSSHPKYEQFFYEGDFFSISAYCTLNNRNYYFCTSVDTVLNQAPICHSIYKCDSSFLPVDGKKYSFDGELYNNYGGRHLMATKSNNLIASGSRGFINNTSSYNTVPIIFSVDTNLNIINSKVLYSFLGAAEFVVEADSGRFYAGLNLTTVGSCIMSFRENGQVDWIKSYIRPRGWMHEGLMLNGSLYVVGFTDSLNISLGGSFPGWFDPAMYLMKLDTSGAVIWCKTYDTPVGKGVAIYSASLRLTHDQQLLMTCMGAAQNNDATLLVKTDLNGDTLWTRFMGYPPTWSCYPKTAVLKNGDLLLKGYYLGGIWQYLAYLYRLPPDGISSCHQMHGVVLTGSLPVTDSLVTMTEVNNIHTQKPAYLVVDTPYVPLFVFDACLYLPVKENPMMTDESLINFYPNPSKGIFQYPNESNVPWIIRVYDAQGRKLETKENQTENPISLNLQSYSAGMYTIVLQYKSSIVTKKVMVE